MRDCTIDISDIEVITPNPPPFEDALLSAYDPVNDTKCNPVSDVTHDLRTGETIEGVYARALQEVLGRPNTQQEWAKRADIVRKGTAEILKVNNLGADQHLVTGMKIVIPARLLQPER